MSNSFKIYGNAVGIPNPKPNLLFSEVDSIDNITSLITSDFNGDALYTTDWDGVECREDAVGKYDADKKELYFPVEMVFEKPEDYLKISIEEITLTKGAYNKNLSLLQLPKYGIHIDEITPVVDFECHLGDYVFIFSETNPAGASEYVEITEDITVDYIIIKSRTFPNCTTTGTISTDDGFLNNLILRKGHLIAPGAYFNSWNAIKNNAIFYDKSTGQAYLNKMPFKRLSGLDKADNTSDLEKPVSTATQEKLDLKANKSDVYTKEEADSKFSNVNEEQLKDAMYNLPIEVLEKTFIHKSTGAKTSPTPSFHSLVYRVFGLSKIRSVNTKLSGNAGWAFYDKDNNVITAGSTLTDIDVPSNAYTFAVSVYLSSMSVEDVAIYADFTNVLAYKSDLESCVRTDISRIFNDDNANAKTKVMAGAIKELYIPDEAYKGILRLCAFRKITNTIASIQLFAYINGTLTSIYRCAAQTVLYGTQLIKLERTSAYGEPAYILVDWDSVPDGTSYTGNTSDIYLLNDKVFDKENSPTINGYIEENPYYNSDVVFDTCFAGEMSTQLLELKRNYNLPHKGMYISTDIDFYEKTSDIKGLIPYLYFNGEKIGTVVLYDDAGNPFVYLKDGTKKVLS